MKDRHSIVFALAKVVNVIAVVIPFIVVWFIYYEKFSMTTGSKKSSTLFLFLYLFVFYQFCRRMDGFRFLLFGVGELVFSQIIAVGVTNVFAVIAIWMMTIHFPNLWPGVLCFFVQCLVITGLVFIFNRYFWKHQQKQKAIVVYNKNENFEQLIANYGLKERYDIQSVHTYGEVHADFSILDGADCVFLSDVHSHDRNVILKRCVERSQKVFLIPRVGDALMDSAERLHMFHLPILLVRRYSPGLEYSIIKRTFDIVVSGVAMLVLSPVFLVVALAVKSDGGPALYKQTRLTRDGKLFTILKFRSMCVDAEKMSGAVLSMGEDDPRVTKVGRVIRRFRIDELPQLWNVFVGEMSIVGPRPERPEIAAQYEKEMPEFSLRLQTKAGMTGYAQVYGKYNTEPYHKLLMDLMYISSSSILEDMLICLATVKILFSKESTEGVQDGQTTAMEEKTE